jgi:hypothetical protein
MDSKGGLGKKLSQALKKKKPPLDIPILLRLIVIPSYPIVAVNNENELMNKNDKLTLAREWVTILVWRSPLKY